jgi:hypothetical protein
VADSSWQLAQKRRQRAEKRQKAKGKRQKWWQVADLQVTNDDPLRNSQFAIRPSQFARERDVL